MCWSSKVRTSLSPDFPSEVFLCGDEKGFPSVTHALEASKSDNEKTRNLIRAAESATEAVALTKKLDTSQWRQTALSTAEKLLRDKFVRYRHLRKVLLRTSGKDLVHTRETFFGVRSNFNRITFSCDEYHLYHSNHKNITHSYYKKIILEHQRSITGAGNNRTRKNHIGRLMMKIRTRRKQGEDRVLRRWIEDTANVRQDAAFDSRVNLRARKDGREVSRHVLDDASVFSRRQPESVVSVSLNHPSSSRNHAAIVHVKDRGLVLIDLGSSHGTTLNGKRLESFVLATITNRSEIKFGLSLDCTVWSSQRCKGEVKTGNVCTSCR